MDFTVFVLIVGICLSVVESGIIEERVPNIEPPVCSKGTSMNSTNPIPGPYSNGTSTNSTHPKPVECYCITIYKPVCGSDNKTYSNLCVFECAQKNNTCLELAHQGECKKYPCNCTEQYAPVCSSNGTTYDNECKLNCTKNYYPDVSKACDGKCPCKNISHHEQHKHHHHHTSTPSSSSSGSSSSSSSHSSYHHHESSEHHNKNNKKHHHISCKSIRCAPGYVCKEVHHKAKCVKKPCKSDKNCPKNQICIVVPESYPYKSCNDPCKLYNCSVNNCTATNQTTNCTKTPECKCNEDCPNNQTCSALPGQNNLNAICIKPCSYVKCELGSVCVIINYIANCVKIPPYPPVNLTMSPPEKLY